MECNFIFFIFFTTEANFARRGSRFLDCAVALHCLETTAADFQSDVSPSPSCQTLIKTIGNHFGSVLP